MNSMHLEHHEEEFPYDALAENLVNTYDVMLPDPEHMKSGADLKWFLTEHGINVPAAANADIPRVRQVRAELRRVFESKSAKAAATRLNRILRGADVALQVRARDPRMSLDWRVSADDDVAEWVRHAAGLNLAFILERYGFERLRVCDSRPCQDVFVDTSKKGVKRFCGSTCSSRFHVAEFRRRHSEDD